MHEAAFWLGSDRLEFICLLHNSFHQLLNLFLQASNIGICLHCLDTEVKLGREGVEDKVSGRKTNLSGYYSHCLGNTLTRKSNSAGCRG